MSDDRNGSQSATAALETGVEKLVSIANRAIADGAPAPLALAMLESNLILILRATGKAADISGETIKGLREENRAMLDLLEKIGRDLDLVGSHGEHLKNILALLDKHGRSP